MSVPQWNADIITPASEAGGTQVIGDNQEVQTTLESGENITIEDGKISATGDLDQVQSDWTESDSSDPSYIQNKPDLSIYAQSANLATVATSGSYADLSNKPTIPSAQVNSDWDAESGVAAILNKPSLATVATSGSYTDLSNKPTIPEAQVNSDWNASTGVAAILNKPDLSIYAQSANLATVATSGSYNDLTNKPTIPAAQVNSDWNAASGVAAILNKPDLSIYAQSANLATVATSGSYADLSNKPTIPTVDQSYSASSTNAMSGVAVAQAVAGAGGLPASTSADENKVLTVDDQGDAGWEMPAVTSTADWTPDPTPYSISGYDPANDYAKGLSGDVVGYDDFSRPSEVLYYQGFYEEKYDEYNYWDLESSTVSDMGGNPDGRYLSLIAWDPYDSSRYFIYNDAQFAQVESYDRSGVTTYKVKDIVNKVITITTGWVDANGDAAIPNLSYGELVLSFFDPTAVPSFSSYYLPNGKLGVQIPTSIIGTILLLKQDTAVLEHLVNRINGKELFAKRALFDVDGNPIVYTYLKQENYRPIPDPGLANAGDVLTAVDDMYSGRTIAWQAPQGGGGSSYTAGDGITIDNNEVSVRIKNDYDNPLKVTQDHGGGVDASLMTPDGTPSSEGWQALADNGYIHSEYDSKTDETHIEFLYRWDRVDSNPLGMQSTGDDTKHFDAKCHLLYISGKESYTNIVATSTTVSDAFTAAWDESNEVCVYNLGSLVDTTDGYVFQIGFTLPGDVGGVFNAIAFSSSGSDYSGISDTVQSSFLSENHVLALQGSSVYIVGDTIPGGDLYVQVDQTYESISAFPQSGCAVSEAINSVRQVPYADSSDEGKVLTVDANGDPAWATGGGGSTYTAGNGIDITNDEISVDTTTVAMKTDIPSVPVTDVTVDGTSVVSNGTAAITMPTVPSAGNMLSVTNNVLNVTTTAGITDIQQVSALPASPVATVLYLIPET